MKKFFTLLVGLVLLSSGTFAQKKVITAVDILKMKMGETQQCRTDLIHNRLMQTDPEYRLSITAARKAAKAYMPGGTKSAKSTTLTIPVVVHILHLGEAVGTGTNISDAQIQSAIDNMNDCFSGTAPYVTDVGIQFQLATRDANCTATTGIVRVDASGTSDYGTNGITDANEQTIKAISKWPNGEYYNIWIVSEINNNGGGAGTQGYAYFPGSSSNVDGAVVLYNSFGYDPTGALGYNLKSYTNRNVTANHEIGHALDLYHTFEGDDGDSDGNPDQCPTNVDPANDGDQCADTDPHRRDDGDCGDSGFTCAGAGTDLSDIVTNIMAYSSDACQVKFSSDQRTRMRAALQGARSTLLTSAGLQAVSGSQPAAALTCTPATTNTSNSFGMGVYGLQIASTEYGSSGAVADGGYRDHWCSNFSLTTNTLYSITVTNGTLNNEDVKVYIDYNNDGDFDDVDEEVFSSNSAKSHTGNFTVPASPTTGTELWVRVVSDFAGNTISGPCYTPQYGQVEDFSAVISAAGSAPVAAFSADQTTVCQGTQINFTDASTNTPTGWTWDFGDGSPTSSTQNPSYTYPTAGTYTVTLTATNASGSDDEVKTNYITINDVPGNAGAVTGSTSECQNATGIAYSVGAVSGASTYTWTVPSGASVTSGQGTTNVTVDFGTTSGNVEVTPGNACGNGGASNAVVTLNSCITTQLQVAYCGFSASVMNTLIRCDVVTGANKYRFRFHNPGTGADYYFERKYSNVVLGWVAGLENNVTYEVYVNWRNSSNVWQTEGAMCNVSTPTTVTTTLTGASCGLVATDLNTMIYADPLGTAVQDPSGNRYRFRFHNPGAGTDLYYDRAYPDMKLSWLVGIQPGITYEVYVSYYTGSATWLEGAACNVTTPATAPTTQLTGSSCGLVASTQNTLIYCDVVSIASQDPSGNRYRFRWHEGGSDLYWYRAYPNMVIGWLTDLQLSTMYEVYVSYWNGSTWIEGSMCNVTTAATLSTKFDDPQMANEGKSLSLDSDLEVSTFPNPVRDLLNVVWEDSGSDVVITLVDLSGKLVYQEMLTNTASVAVNMSDLNAGLYILRVTAGERNQTIKIMKE